MEAKKGEHSGAYHSTRLLHVTDASGKRGLCLRFSQLRSKNGFKRVAETVAIYHEKTGASDLGTEANSPSPAPFAPMNESSEIKKIALKQTYDLSEYQENPEQSEIRIGKNHYQLSQTTGSITSKGNTFSWDLTLYRQTDGLFNPVSETLGRIKMIKNHVLTLSERLTVSGKSMLNGKETRWDNAPAMEQTRRGTRNDHSWIWGHCNTFKDEQGQMTDFIFEGLSTQTKIGPVLGPLISSFYFYYQGKPYLFNTLRSLLQIKSNSSLTEWNLSADQGDIAFRGKLSAAHRDFGGMMLEDTPGSFLYSSASKLSSMQIHIYRNGKLEKTLTSNGTTSFEIVSREKNPYVPIIL